MLCYFHSEYDKHVTLESSFENDNRIKDVLIKIPDLFKIECEFKENDYQIYLDKLKIIQEYYNQLKYWNCEKCSYQNFEDEDRCEICDEKNNKNIKLVSKIEGDTTSLSDSSMNCLIKNLQTIYFTIDSQMNNSKDGFILIRPPGHHSNFCKDSIFVNPQGFCILNNISFGVDYIINKYNYKKVAIIDWDVHHGNGTQDIFYTRKDVLFIDLHRYDGKFYPGSGKEEEKGEKEGYGYNINIPLSKGSGEDVYLQKFNDIIIPTLKEYNPDWIFISCGFDAHESDPLGGMNLKDESYFKFYELIKDLKKPITMFLEGGYNPDVIFRCISNILNF